MTLTKISFINAWAGRYIINGEFANEIVQEKSE